MISRKDSDFVTLSVKLASPAFEFWTVLEIANVRLSVLVSIFDQVYVAAVSPQIEVSQVGVLEYPVQIESIARTPDEHRNAKPIRESCFAIDHEDGQAVCAAHLTIIVGPTDRAFNVGPISLAPNPFWNSKIRCFNHSIVLIIRLAFPSS